MKKLASLVALAACLLAPAAAIAHPLGNFTINRYSGIELSGGRVYVHYVLDLAEIPTYQQGDRVRSNGFAAAAARKLDLRIGGRAVALRPVSHRATYRPGAGGLRTLRFEAIYSGDAGTGGAFEYRDRNFESRIGWREVVVGASAGAKLGESSVPSASVSDELRAYPGDLLQSPLDVSDARGSFEAGSGPGTAPSFSEIGAAEHSKGGFESLVSRGDLSLGVILISLLVAAFWGAAHALTPGHGKAIVAGYLVGTRGRPIDAVLLGGIVTVTHTAGVFALGFITLMLSQFIVPETLYPWLTLVSGLLVVAVGGSVLLSRLRGRAHGHSHAPGHSHGHGHHHHDDVRVDRRGLIGVGLAAGVLPCPSALVVLLSAIALHRIGFGFALIIAFSVGLAATITSIGLVAVLAKRTFSKITLEGRFVRALPALSALVILGVGVALTVKAIPGVV